MELENSTYAYLYGWCDYTGWGCQDGGYIAIARDEEDLPIPHDKEWDHNPADLNKWLTEGAKSWEER